MTHRYPYTLALCCVALASCYQQSTPPAGAAQDEDAAYNLVAGCMLTLYDVGLSTIDDRASVVYVDDDEYNRLSGGWYCPRDAEYCTVDDDGVYRRGLPTGAYYLHGDRIIVLSVRTTDGVERRRLLAHEYVHNMLDVVTGDPDVDHSHPAFDTCGGVWATQ